VQHIFGFLKYADFGRWVLIQPHDPPIVKWTHFLGHRSSVLTNVKAGSASAANDRTLAEEAPMPSVRAAAATKSTILRDMACSIAWMCHSHPCHWSTSAAGRIVTAVTIRAITGK
jgi:hypothetical protein